MRRAIPMVLGLLVPLVSGSAAPRAARDSRSEVLSVENTVEYAPAGGPVWHAARAHMRLNLGDSLRTGRDSRATVRLADLSIFRVSELSLLQILEPAARTRKPLLDLRSGSTYLFSREKPADIQFRTPVVVGAIRGTEFGLEVGEDGRTRVTVLDGEVELGNAQGRVVLRSGEQAAAVAGQAPTKTAVIDALGTIQWCLYYPAVLNPDELGLDPAEQAALGPSLQAYRSGDLLAALAAARDAVPASDAARIYSAALRLAVGQVAQAEAILQSLATPSPLADALRQMARAVRNRPQARTAPARLASEWMAASYASQARSQLADALRAARAAAAQAPAFGFAWVRVAELEFSFGRIEAAQAALRRGLELSPRNAQGLALKGFLLCARQRFGEAMPAFEEAMAVDGALGNAWLGRGLCRIRGGDTAGGLGDLQVAATLEPQRSVLRSYLAKAFHHAGQEPLAEKDLRLARQLDPNDPTSWLYSALLRHQQNRVNEAVRDLEHSQALNDHRSVYRSRLLLDQDRAVRSANLAALYRDAGMHDVGVREAGRAVAYDYANYSAHLFLANSYDLWRDPKLYNLRYEAAQIGEWLMYNLLAPVGAGSLSQKISQQEYARLFDGNRLGFFSSTEYLSRGDWTETASQYGTLDNTGYALDAFYHRSHGDRPNNDLEQKSFSGQVKHQLTPKDSVYGQVQYNLMTSGDVAQYYRQSSASRGLDAEETQFPNVFLGYHREWRPGLHTLVFAGRLDDEFERSDPAAGIPFLQQREGVVRSVSGVPQAVAMRSDLAAYTAELQQIWQTGPHTLIGGARYQRGNVDTRDTVTDVFDQVVASQSVHSTIERLQAYAYDQWQLLPSLHLTAGLSYDRLNYPRNLDTSPVSTAQHATDQLSPKAGLLWSPARDLHLRGAFTRSLGGVFFDNSFRLEPTQVAGINQAFRSLAPESAIGLVPAARFQTFGAGADYKLRANTYLGVEGEFLQSDGRRWIGVLTNSAFIPVPDSPGSTAQRLDYEERTLRVTVNRLIHREWSLGARYRLSRAALKGRFSTPGASALNQDETATLQQLALSLHYHHPCGLFGQFQSVWCSQDYGRDLAPLSGADFWQHHVTLGYRLPNRRAELALSVLNLADRDYKLHPLNLHADLPRERTLAARFTFEF